MWGQCETCGRRAQLVEYTRVWFGGDCRTSRLCSECLTSIRKRPLGKGAKKFIELKTPKKKAVRTARPHVEASREESATQSQARVWLREPGPVEVNYALAQAWKQRAEYAVIAERLARQAVKASLRAMKATGFATSERAEEAREAAEAAAEAAREAEEVWAETASMLRKQ